MHFIGLPPNIQKFLRPFSLFRWFKKSSCQLMAKECALSTGKLPRRLAQEQCGKGNWPRPKWPKMCWRAVKQKSNQNQYSKTGYPCYIFFSLGVIKEPGYSKVFNKTSARGRCISARTFALRCIIVWSLAAPSKAFSEISIRPRSEFIGRTRHFVNFAVTS